MILMLIITVYKIDVANIFIQNLIIQFFFYLHVPLLCIFVNFFYCLLNLYVIVCFLVSSCVVVADFLQCV